MTGLKRLALVAPALVGILSVILVVGLPSVALSDDDSHAFGATLTSFQETPTLSTNGHGTVRLVLNPDNIQYTLTFSDLSSAVQVAHLHLGARGLVGGVFVFLCGGGKPSCTSPMPITGIIAAGDIMTPSTGGIVQSPTPFTLAAAEQAIRAGVVYANVHTSNYPGGEIRGQVSRGDQGD